MPNTNDFQPFGIAVGANVLTQAEWIVLAALANGFSSGIAPSDACNKAWRQATVPGSVLMQFVSDILAEDVVDDGDTAVVQDQLERALAKFAETYSSKTTSYAGNPNGFVAGTQAAAGTRAPDVVWDITHAIWWLCTTTGVAAAAVWRPVTSKVHTTAATGNVTLAVAPDQVIEVAANADGETKSLPLITDAWDGYETIIANANDKWVNYQRNAGDASLVYLPGTAGVTTWKLGPRESVTLRLDGTNWVAVAQARMPLYIAASLSVDFGITSGAAEVEIPMDTVDQAARSIDVWLNVMNGRITPLLAGKWEFESQLSAQAGGSTRGEMSIRKNGVAGGSPFDAFQTSKVVSLGNEQTVSSAGQDMQSVAVYSLNGSTDYVSVWGGITNALSAPFFQGNSGGFRQSYFIARYLGP